MIVHQTDLLPQQVDFFLILSQVILTSFNVRFNRFDASLDVGDLGRVRDIAVNMLADHISSCVHELIESKN